MLFSFFESVSDEEKKFNKTGAWAKIHKSTYKLSQPSFRQGCVITGGIKFFSKLFPLVKAPLRRHDTQYEDIQHKDTQHEGIVCVIQHAGWLKQYFKKNILKF